MSVSLLAPPEGGAIMIWEFLMSMGGGVIDFFLILWWILFFTIFTMDNLTDITSVNLKRSDDSSNTGEYVSRWCFYSISSKYKIKKIAGSLCIRTSFLPFREGRQSCMFCLHNNWCWSNSESLEQKSPWFCQNNLLNLSDFDYSIRM